MFQARAKQRRIDPSIDAELFEIHRLEPRQPTLVEFPQAVCIGDGARFCVEPLHIASVGGEPLDQFAKFARCRRRQRRHIRDIIRRRASGSRIGLSNSRIFSRPRASFRSLRMG